jgi:hypothetical protein
VVLPAAPRLAEEDPTAWKAIDRLVGSISSPMRLSLALDSSCVARNASASAVVPLTRPVSTSGFGLSPYARMKCPSILSSTLLRR